MVVEAPQLGLLYILGFVHGLNACRYFLLFLYINNKTNFIFEEHLRDWADLTSINFKSWRLVLYIIIDEKTFGVEISTIVVVNLSSLLVKFGGGEARMLL